MAEYREFWPKLVPRSLEEQSLGRCCYLNIRVLLEEGTEAAYLIIDGAPRTIGLPSSRVETRLIGLVINNKASQALYVSPLEILDQCP